MDSLKMSPDGYKQLREEQNQDWIIDELQRRRLEKELATYNLWALRESLMRDHSIANRTFLEWQPSEERFMFCIISV